MNWNLLKKSNSIQRPELDSSTQSANEALEKLVAEFVSAENATKSLFISAKKLPDHILCTGKFDTKLADELSNANLFADDDFMNGICEEWHSFAFHASSLADEYVISIQNNLIEPLKQLRNAFLELRTAIRQHDSLQLEVIKLQRKVASYSEKDKSVSTSVKLQESKDALANSQKEFARQTQVLVKDLTKFLNGSVEMLQPLLEGFVAAEVTWIRACKNLLEDRHSMSNLVEFDTQATRARSIEESFRSLGSLSICSDSK